MQVLEIATNLATLAPLYSISQPFALLKTRWQYQIVQAVPAPKIEEVDEFGNAVKAKKKPRPISWRRILQQEGASALWKGWGCRVLHQALWRSFTATGYEMLLYAPGKGPLVVFSKLLFAMGISAVLLHPLHVLESRVLGGYNIPSTPSGTLCHSQRSLLYACLRLSFALPALFLCKPFTGQDERIQHEGNEWRPGSRAQG